jgi:hypothetical protein
MTTRTRYFVIVSLLVLTVGLGTGLVAYYMGFPAGAFATQGGPDELRLVPANATLVAHANVHDIMTSNLRERFRQALPTVPDGQGEFAEKTGINIETDIDRVVAALAPVIDGSQGQRGFSGTGLVLARGRFDEVRIEALMREHGATVDPYKGHRVIVSSHDGSDKFSVAFIESGLAAVGSQSLVRTAIDLKAGGANVQSVVANDEMMERIQALDGGNAWAVGRFDALTSQARLPSEVVQRIPSLTWFSASGHVNGGISGVIRAEARDEVAANNLRDVVRGVLALAKLQTGGRPEVQAAIDSLELGGTGTDVSLGFSIPAELFDAIAPKPLPEKQPGN